MVLKGKKLPNTEDIVHERFLACVEKNDANGAMAHFAFIACEGGRLVTLRRRQLVVMLSEQGMIKEASELLTNAVASPSFDSQDLPTIVSSLVTRLSHYPVVFERSHYLTCHWSHDVLSMKPSRSAVLFAQYFGVGRSNTSTGRTHRAFKAFTKHLLPRRVPNIR